MMAAEMKAAAKGAQPKRPFKELVSTPGKNISSPARKQCRKEAEQEIFGPSKISTALKSEIIEAISEALDSKLDHMAKRIEAMVSSKIKDLETKFKHVEDEVKKLKEDVDESINHVEGV